MRLLARSSETKLDAKDDIERSCVLQDYTQCYVAHSEGANIIRNGYFAAQEPQYVCVVCYAERTPQLSRLRLTARIKVINSVKSA